jgi:putative ABC transport system permease protein
VTRAAPERARAGAGSAELHPGARLGGGLGAALAIGAIAGLLPALRAARMSPTKALRTV